MNKVEVFAKDIKLPEWSKKARSFAKKVLKELKKDNWEVSILFCGDKIITELNSRFRDKNEPTDILSFRMGDTIKEKGKTVFIAGDIVISLEYTRKNAEFFKISLDEELRRLIIHGILHLDNMSHETNDQNEPMLILQEEILKKLDSYCITGGIN